MKEAVLKTLRLTLSFRQKWEQGLLSFRSLSSTSLPPSHSLSLSLLHTHTHTRTHTQLVATHSSRAEGKKMESDFSKCSHFLVTCLNNTVKRGSFPYCELMLHVYLYMYLKSVGQNSSRFLPPSLPPVESLAFSLTTLKTDQRIFAP